MISSYSRLEESRPIIVWSCLIFSLFRPSFWSEEPILFNLFWIYLNFSICILNNYFAEHFLHNKIDWLLSETPLKIIKFKSQTKKLTFLHNLNAKQQISQHEHFQTFDKANWWLLHRTWRGAVCQLLCSNDLCQTAVCLMHIKPLRLP